jgi:hypothetical protein
MDFAPFLHHLLIYLNAWESRKKKSYPQNKQKVIDSIKKMPLKNVLLLILFGVLRRAKEIIFSN